MMKILLKILVVPFALALSLLAALLVFLFDICAFLLTIASVILAVLGIALFFTPTPIGGIELYRAAQAEMRRLLGGAKLPKMDVLKEEGRKLMAKKKRLYGEYQKARRDMQEIITIKANIDALLGYTEPGRIASWKYRTKLLKCSKNLTTRRLHTGCVHTAIKPTISVYLYKCSGNPATASARIRTQEYTAVICMAERSVTVLPAEEPPK